MHHAAGRCDGLDLEHVLEAFQLVPQARAASEQDRHDHDVHVVDQPRRDEVADHAGAAPEAHVLPTSAGVSTGIDMALAMVAGDLDAAVAGEVAKRLVLYARRPGHQSQFSPLLQAQAKADSPFADLIGWIHAHLAAPLDVPALAARAGLSERTFHRKFIAATGETPARFVETARLDAARLLLARGVSLKSVAVQVGLFPATRLTQAFEQRFGISPRLFRDMHAGF